MDMAKQPTPAQQTGGGKRALNGDQLEARALDGGGSTPEPTGAPSEAPSAMPTVEGLGVAGTLRAVALPQACDDAAFLGVIGHGISSGDGIFYIRYETPHFELVPIGTILIFNAHRNSVPTNWIRSLCWPNSHPARVPSGTAMRI